MTLSDDTIGEIGVDDVTDSKQRQLEKEIQDIVKADEFSKDIPFDSGW
jgi:hypothetical protein